MKKLSSFFTEENEWEIHPLIDIPIEELKGTVFNPTILNDNGSLHCIVRTSNYLFHYSHKIVHPDKKVAYIHPENDMRLVTWNYYGELNSKRELVNVKKVDTNKTQNYKSKWTFVGHEDVRLVKWNDTFYLSGIRRDVKPNGESRMELCKFSIHTGQEYDRIRIPIPGEESGEKSYCEKNWMPILDKPFHWVKWSNPVQVVKYCPTKKITETVHLSDKTYKIPDLRGSSQLIPYDNGYIALTHSTRLWNTQSKDTVDAIYTHRFIKYSKDFEITQMSPEFSFMGGDIEFSCGMTIKDNKLLIPFSYKDSNANIFECNVNILNKILENV